jgi:hypothetical protein
VWRDRRRGRLARLPRLPDRLRPLAGLPARRLARGVLFSAAVTALLAGPAAAALAAGAPDGLARGPFIAYKTALGVGLGLVVTPLIALGAMADRLD